MEVVTPKHATKINFPVANVKYFTLGFTKCFYNTKLCQLKTTQT